MDDTYSFILKGKAVKIPIHAMGLKSSPVAGVDNQRQSFPLASKADHVTRKEKKCVRIRNVTRTAIDALEEEKLLRTTLVALLFLQQLHSKIGILVIQLEKLENSNINFFPR